MDQLRIGIKLEDGMTTPALVELRELSDARSIVDITIHEGRNRQVRRMFSAIGYSIRRLI